LTGFVKRGLPHISNLSALTMVHNLRCVKEINSKFTVHAWGTNMDKKYDESFRLVP